MSIEYITAFKLLFYMHNKAHKRTEQELWDVYSKKYINFVGGRPLFKALLHKIKMPKQETTATMFGTRSRKNQAL